MTFRFQSLPSTIFVIPRGSESIQSSASLPRGSLAVLHYFYSSCTRIARQYGKFTSNEKEKLRTPGIAAKGLHGPTAKAGQGPPALSSEVVNLQILSWKNWKHKTSPTSGWGGCSSENTGGVRGGKQRDRPFRRRTRTKAASGVPSARLCPSRPGRRSPEGRRRWRGAPPETAAVTRCPSQKPAGPVRVRHSRLSRRRPWQRGSRRPTAGRGRRAGRGGARGRLRVPDEPRARGGGRATAMSSGQRCPVCAEPWVSPRLLPCLHSLCVPCLRRLGTLGETGRAAATAARSVLCPVCDSEVTLPPGGIGQLTPDYLALNRSREATGCDLCADGAAARRCLTCGADLCLFCCQAHR